MGAFDDGSPLGGLFSFFSGLGGSQGYAPSADTSNAPQVDQFRSDWNASQKASGLPFDDKTFTGWLQAQQQPQAAPEAQTVPLPGFLQGLLGGGNKAAAWQPYGANPLPSAQQTQASPEDQRVPLPGFLQGLLGGGGSQQATPGPQQATPDPMRDALKLPWIFRPPWLKQFLQVSGQGTPEAAQPVTAVSQQPIPGYTGGGPATASPANQQALPAQQAPATSDQPGFTGGGPDQSPMQQAMQSPPPLLVGDSIAGHMITFGGGSGSTDRNSVGKYQNGQTAVNGFTPSKILDTVIPGIPDEQIKGRNVVLSTGASNDPSQLDAVPQQIAALKERGATGVTVMGVGTAPQLKGVNDRLAKIATDAGATFAGPLSNVKADGIHSADPKGDLAAITQAPAGGDYGGGDDTAPMQQAMQGAPGQQEPQDFGGGDDSSPMAAAMSPGGSASPGSAASPKGQQATPTGRGRVLDLIEKNESGGRNIPQQIVGPHGGYNPSTGTVTGPSSAQGYFQITNTTWKEWASKAGVDLNKYPNAMSAPYDVQRSVADWGLQHSGVQNWANYNPRLNAQLKGEGFPTHGVIAGGPQADPNAPDATGGGPTGQADRANPDAPGYTGGGPGSGASPGSGGGPGGGPSLDALQATPMAGTPGAPNATISVGQNGAVTTSPGAAAILGPQLPGVGASGLSPAFGLNLPPDAKPADVLDAFMKSGSPEATRLKLMLALQEKMHPQSNMAATLAHMASGFLGGKGPAASLAGGFGGMAEGLGQSTQTANQFQLGNLKSLEGAIPGADPLDNNKLRYAKFLADSGVPAGDALAQAGVQIDPASREQANKASTQAKPVDDSIDHTEYRALLQQGVPPSVAARATRKNATQEDIAAADPYINSNKPLPPFVQKAADKQVADLASIRQSRAVLDHLQDEVYSGRLNLNRFNQYLLKGKAAAGLTDDEVLDYQKYVAAMHTLQSDELRKNAGVQTDADAEREMQRLMGGGITSSKQFIAHTNYLNNQGMLAELGLRQRHEQLYARAKQQMPEGYWEGVETTLPGTAPTKTAKEIGADMYADNSGKNRVFGDPQVGGSTGVGLSPDDKAVIQRNLPKP